MQKNTNLDETCCIYDKKSLCDSRYIKKPCLKITLCLCVISLQTRCYLKMIVLLNDNIIIKLNFKDKYFKLLHLLFSHSLIMCVTRVTVKMWLALHFWDLFHNIIITTLIITFYQCIFTKKWLHSILDQNWPFTLSFGTFRKHYTSIQQQCKRYTKMD